VQQLVTDMSRERGPGPPRTPADLEAADAVTRYPLRVLRIVAEDLDRIEGKASLTDSDLERMKKGLAVAREAKKFLCDAPPTRSRSPTGPTGGRQQEKRPREGSTLARLAATARKRERELERETGENSRGDPGKEQVGNDSQQRPNAPGPTEGEGQEGVEKGFSATYVPAGEAISVRHHNGHRRDTPPRELDLSAFCLAIRRGASAGELQRLLADAIGRYQRSDGADE
jgi:hypothetical protein